MPKLKTKKSFVKKIKITKKGKVVRRRAFAAHLRSKKNASAKHRGTVEKVDTKAVPQWNNLIKGNNAS